MRIFRAFIAALFILPMLAAAAVAQSEYQVRSGDTLQLEVLEDSSLNRSLLVLPDGRVSVPFVGSVPARGQTLGQIQASIRAGLAPNFAEPPTVFVGLQELVVSTPRAPAEPVLISVYVLGEVTSPGKIEIEPGTTILQFLAEMGGFSNFAATKRIQLRTSRTGEEQVYTLNYDQIERGAGIGTATVMADGDVIIVPQRRLFE